MLVIFVFRRLGRIYTYNVFIFVCIYICVKLLKKRVKGLFLNNVFFLEFFREYVFFKVFYKWKKLIFIERFLRSD